MELRVGGLALEAEYLRFSIVERDKEIGSLIISGQSG